MLKSILKNADKTIKHFNVNHIEYMPDKDILKLVAQTDLCPVWNASYVSFCYIHDFNLEESYINTPGKWVNLGKNKLQGILLNLLSFPGFHLRQHVKPLTEYSRLWEFLLRTLFVSIARKTGNYRKLAIPPILVTFVFLTIYYFVRICLVMLCMCLEFGQVCT